MFMLAGLCCRRWIDTVTSTADIRINSAFDERVINGYTKPRSTLRTRPRMQQIFTWSMSMNSVTPLEEKTTALLRAAAGGQGAEVDALLAAGARVNASDEDGATPLICAARAGHAGIVRALLAARAVVDAKDWGGATALLWAAR
ncbi:MAG: ankyrin repeat domain-containing protein, partial [Ottowia sp.]|nr:ankyrin repeat domain-containing protein [Ottowia sp.]